MAASVMLTINASGPDALVSYMYQDSPRLTSSLSQDAPAVHTIRAALLGFVLPAIPFGLCREAKPLRGWAAIVSEYIFPAPLLKNANQNKIDPYFQRVLPGLMSCGPQS